MSKSEARMILKLREELLGDLGNIRAHAVEMQGKCAAIYDKTSPILSTVDAMIKRLGK